MNYFARTANSSNSYTYPTMSKREIGDTFVHSIHGKGIVVAVTPYADRSGYRLIVRKDITLDQLIEAL